MIELKNEYPDNEEVVFLGWSGYNWKMCGPARLIEVTKCSQRMTTVTLNMTGQAIRGLETASVFPVEESLAAIAECERLNTLIGGR